MARGHEIELARGREVEQPGGQHTVVDHGAARGRQALGVERPAAKAALAQRIVEDVDALGEHALAHPVFQERGAARHGAADGGVVGGGGLDCCCVWPFMV